MKADEEEDSVNARIQSEQLRHGKIGDKTKLKKPVAPTKRKKKSLIMAVALLEKQVQSLQLEQRRIQHQNKLLEEHVAQLHAKYGLPPFVVTPQSPTSSIIVSSPKLSAVAASSSPVPNSPLERHHVPHPSHDRLDRKAPPPPPSSSTPGHLSLHIPEVSVSPSIILDSDSPAT